MAYGWSAWCAVTIRVVSRISAIETKVHREDSAEYDRNR